MAKITTNQHSYSNASALLNVSATATRTGAGKVSITADWEIKTSASSLDGSRFLVLYVNSESGTKYFSTRLRSSWDSDKTYSGSYTFTDVVLDSAATSIKIGFGVCKSSLDVTETGILVWNGKASVSSSSYDPDIQFGTITGIAAWYTKCGKPNNTTLAPSEFVGSVTISWEPGSDGTNNAVTGYEVQMRRRTAAGVWNEWAASSINTSGYTFTPSNVEWGGAIQYRVRTQGSAGASYYSDWNVSNVAEKVLPPAYVHEGGLNVPCAIHIYTGGVSAQYAPYRYANGAWSLLS